MTHLKTVQCCIMAVAEVIVLVANTRLGVGLGVSVLTCVAGTGSMICSSCMLVERLLLLLLDFTVGEE